MESIYDLGDTELSYEEFKSYVAVNRIDVGGDIVAASNENLGYNSHIYHYPHNITKLALRYVSEHSPELMATTANTLNSTAQGVPSPPLFNPYWPDDCRPLLRAGFWPLSDDVDEYAVFLYLKYTDEELEEIDPDGLHSSIQALKYSLQWIYTPVGLLHTASARNGKGLQLSIQAPDLIYESGRPKTDMMIFRDAEANRLPYDNVSSGKCTISGEDWLTIPVTRYANGMGGSLFYDTPSTTQWCGTFYYYEPESTTFLAYKKAFRSFNKTTAIQELLTNSGREELIDEYLTSRDPRYRGNLYLASHINGDLPVDLMVEEDDITYYGGVMDYELYGVEDDLDQRLCQLAAKLGYDIVVLESMVGSFQVVTEVLDVRSRRDSLKSLIYTY